jgi:hypothetical protein
MNDHDEWTEEQEEHYRNVMQAIQHLAADGKIVDSGKRRLNPRTGQMGVVWVAADA